MLIIYMGYSYYKLLTVTGNAAFIEKWYNPNPNQRAQSIYMHVINYTYSDAQKCYVEHSIFNVFMSHKLRSIFNTLDIVYMYICSLIAHTHAQFYTNSHLSDNICFPNNVFLSVIGNELLPSGLSKKTFDVPCM